MATHDHSHDGASHSHPGGDHGHTHEIYDGPGSFLGREMPIVEGRDWRERAFTVGIGGYVLDVLVQRECSQAGSDTRIDPSVPERQP